MAYKRPRDDADNEAAETVKRSTYFAIPRDQQKLLDCGKSSYHHVRQQPNGVQSAIPPSVLEGLEAYHRRIRSTAANSSNQSSRDVDKATDTAEAQPRRSQRTRDFSQHDSTQTSNPQNLQSPLPSSSPGSLLPWSPSPTSQRTRNAGVPASQRVEETPAIRPGVPNRRNVLSRAIDFNFPSSDGSEHEIEVEIPDAQLEDLQPRANAARRSRNLLASSPLKSVGPTQNTPPCAQPQLGVIPSTLEQGPREPARPNGPVTRGGRWKRAPWPESQVSNQPECRKARMPITKRWEAKSPDSTQSSSIVPATLEPTSNVINMHPRHSRGLEAGAKNALASSRSHARTHLKPSRPQSAAPLKEGISSSSRDGQNDSRAKVHNESLESAAMEVDVTADELAQAGLPQRSGEHTSQGAGHGFERVSNAGTSSNETFVYRNGPASLPLTLSAFPLDASHDPMQYFTSVYPSYVQDHNGDLPTFIQAVATLASLDENQQLKSILFDDFVRAFSSGYMAYKARVPPNGECQPAFAWFNWKDEETLFLRGVLSKKNLGLVKAAYPREFAEAESLLIQDTPEREVSLEHENGMRETTEVGEAEADAEMEEPHHRVHEPDEDEESDNAFEEVNKSADVELREPAPPRKSRTNGAYLAKQGHAARTTESMSRQARSSEEASVVEQETNDEEDEDNGLDLQRRSSRRDTSASLDTTSEKQPARHEVRQSIPSTPNRPKAAGDGRSKTPPSASRFAALVVDMESDDEAQPAPVAPKPKTATPTPSAAPSVSARQKGKAVAAPMPPPRSASKPRQGSAGAPPSSSVSSVRRVSSSAAQKKPRPSGMSYLQRLAQKSSDNEKRDARMRELGRAKRMSSGGSVASSHASSK